MLKIIDVDYIKDFKLRLKFNNNEIRIADLSEYLTGEVFGELKNHDLFVQYALTGTTIEWVNGADFAPEFLYEIGKPVEVKTPLVNLLDC